MSGSESLTYPELLELRNTDPNAALTIDLATIGQLGPGTKPGEGYRWQAVCYYASSGFREHAIRLARYGTFDSLTSDEATYFLCELAVLNLSAELNARFLNEAQVLIRSLASEPHSEQNIALLRISLAAFSAAPSADGKWSDLAEHITDLHYSSFQVFVLMYRLAESWGWLDYPAFYRSYLQRVSNGFSSLRHRGAFADSAIATIEMLI